MNNSPSKVYFDPYLFFSLFALSVFGLFFLYSASNADISIVLKQSVYIILGFVIMILVSQADPDLFRRTSLMFIILSVLLLGLTFLVVQKLTVRKDGLESVLFPFSPLSYLNWLCQYF